MAIEDTLPGTNFPLRRAVAALAALTILVLAAVFAVQLRETRAQALENGLQHAEGLSRSLEEHAARTLAGIDQRLRMIGEWVALADGESALTAPELQGMLQRRLEGTPQAQDFFVISAQGTLIASAAGGVTQHAGGFAERPFFRAHTFADSDFLFVGQPFRGEEGDWRLHISRRLQQDGGFAGVAAAELRIGYFTDLYRGIAVGPNGAITLAKDDGTIVTRWPQPDLFSGASSAASPLFREYLPRARAGHYTAVSQLDGIERQTVYRLVPDLPFVLVVGQAVDDLLAEWRQDVRHTVLLVLGVSLAILLLAAVLIHQIARQQAWQRRLQDAIDSLPEGFTLYDASDRLLMVNEAHRRIFPEIAHTVLPGSTFEEGLQAWIDTGATVEAREDPVAWRTSRLNHHRHPGDAEEMTTPGGRVVRVSKRRTSEGGTVAVHADVTELRQALHQLAERQDWLNAILNNVADGIVTFDAEGRIEQINRTGAAIFGHDPESLIGAPVSLLVPGPDLEIRGGGVGRFRTSRTAGAVPVPRQLSGRHYDGTEVPLEMAVARLDLPTRTVYVGAFRDITQRRRTEARLQRLTTFQRAMLDSANNTIIATDTEGTIALVNPAVERLLGYRPQDLIGRVTPEHLHDSEEMRRNAEAVGREQGVPTPQGFAALTARARAGLPDEREWVYVAADGRHIPVLLSITALRDDSDQLIGFLGIGTDITERKRIEKMKSEFISVVSHELRTPLTSIRGSLGLLKGGFEAMAPDQRRQLIDIAAANSERLITLINDILDIEKIESNQAALTVRPVPLPPFLEQSLAQLAGYADQYGVALTLEASSVSDLAVAGDDARLMQVMANLLSNAIKFSPRGGEVAVLARPGADDTVVITVSDQGPGIPEAFRDRLFQKFAQADSSDTRQKGGTGLGLAISKAIVERHDGRIEVETETGKGTRFHVHLPRAAAAAVADDGQAESLGTALGAVGQPALPVLICEDDPDIGRLMELMLSGAGLRTELVRTGNAALRRLRERRFTALVLDLTLPDRSGEEVIADLRADAALRDLPVIVVSARASEGRATLNGGAVSVIDWIDKPIDEARLLAAIRALPGPRAGDRPRVLHVEDDPDVRRVTELVLGTAVIVDAAATLSEARTRLANEIYDLILLDLSLPDGSGEDLLPVILDGPKPPVPVVVFSALDASDAVSARVSASLVKARTDPHDLLDTVLSLLPLPTRSDDLTLD